MLGTGRRRGVKCTSLSCDLLDANSGRPHVWLMDTTNSPATRSFVPASGPHTHADKSPRKIVHANGFVQYTGGYLNDMWVTSWEYRLQCMREEIREQDDAPATC